MILKFASALILTSCLAAAAPIVYIATDQTGQQTQIDVSHTSSWLFTPLSTLGFGGGLFTMKDGQSTSADIVFALYEGSSASGTLLGSVTLTHTQFCTGFQNCGQFAFHQFFFSSPVTLTAGTTYFADLTSTAVNTQSLAYFIKDGNYFASDAAGTPITPSPFDFGSGSSASVAAPEPGSLVFVCGGLGLIISGLIKRRR